MFSLWSQIILCLYWLTPVFLSVLCYLLFCGLGLCKHNIDSFTSLLLFILLWLFIIVLFWCTGGEWWGLYCTVSELWEEFAICSQGISADDPNDILSEDFPKSKRNSFTDVVFIVLSGLKWIYTVVGHNWSCATEFEGKNQRPQQ